MANGAMEACALKRVPYGAAEQQLSARSELDALQQALGSPYMVQGLAAFEHTVSGQAYMWIASR